jgi:DedD protein
MNLAFWKDKQSRRKPGGSASASEPAYEDPAQDDDAGRSQVERMRVRARRRLIGAAALLLLVVVLVPMVLDNTPRPLPDSIPIDMPSDRTPFAPKLAPPPPEAPAPASDASATPAAPGSAADSATPGGQEPAEASAPADAKAGPRIYVQAGAMAKESSAKELASKLGKAGLSSFVERAQSAGGARYRVRVGPFATRDEAERARARLHEMGITANIVVA